jgi:hypothetical protein
MAAPATKIHLGTRWPWVDGLEVSAVVPLLSASVEAFAGETSASGLLSVWLLVLEKFMVVFFP